MRSLLDSLKDMIGDYNCLDFYIYLDNERNKKVIVVSTLYFNRTFKRKKQEGVLNTFREKVYSDLYRYSNLWHGNNTQINTYIPFKFKSKTIVLTR